MSGQLASAVAADAMWAFHSAIVVSAPAASGQTRLGMLVLGSATQGFFDREGYSAVRIMARSLATEFHECFHSLLRQDLMTSIHLTPTDLLLLAHERDGRPTKTIAKFVNLTEQAVDARFRRINAKLRSSGRQQSARLAVEYGLI